MNAPDSSPQPELLEDVQHWLAFVNPRSSAYDRVQHQLETLESSDFKAALEVIEPRGEETLEEAQARLLGRISLGSGVIIFSGDGGTNHIVNSVLQTPELEDIHVPIFSAGSGNGNDITHVHTGKPGSRPITHILRYGDITPIHPIKSVVEQGSATALRYAVAYMGFGSTAKGATLFDDKLHRNNPLYAHRTVRGLMEARIVARTVFEAEDYPVVTADGREHLFSELSIANYPREAKYGRWPVKPLEERLFVSGIERQNFRRSIAWLGRLASGSVPGARYISELTPQGHYLEKFETFGFTTAEKALPVHWDAEHAILPVDTRVTIGRSERPFHAVTTKL